MAENRLATLIKAILDGDRLVAVEETQQLLAKDMSREEIITAGIEKAMEELDQLCTAEQFNLLEIMLAGRATDTVMKVLFPDGLTSEKTKGTVVVGALEGDIHDLGKNIVKRVLTANGYYVVDCGKDAPAEKIIDATKREQALAIAISGLITTVIPQIQQLKKQLQESGLDKVKVLAGGAALKQSTASGLQVDYVGDTVFDVVHYLNSLTPEAQA